MTNDDVESRLSPLERGRRIGATEGTGFGFLAAASIMGMVWVGSIFGTELPITDGGWSALFFAIGIVTVIAGMTRAD